MNDFKIVLSTFLFKKFDFEMPFCDTIYLHDVLRCVRELN